MSNVFSYPKNIEDFVDINLQLCGLPHKEHMSIVRSLSDKN